MHLRGCVLSAVISSLAMLAGCTNEIDFANEGCGDDMTRDIQDQQLNRPEHWGATQNLKAPWAENQRKTVLYKPPFRKIVRAGHATAEAYCVPQAQSILLTSQKSADPGSGNYAFRWVIGIGGGGSKAQVKVDMLNTQQVSVAGENITIEAVCERADPTQTFDTPNPISIMATATIADGNVSSGQATYTQGFTTAAGATSQIAIPAMATSFRLIGRDEALTTNPFVATTVVKVLTSYPSGINSYVGSKLNQYASDFIPLSGLARRVDVFNGAATIIEYSIQWGLDL